MTMEFLRYIWDDLEGRGGRLTLEGQVARRRQVVPPALIFEGEARGTELAASERQKRGHKASYPPGRSEGSTVPWV